MKNALLSLVFLALTTFFAQAQEIPQTQSSLIIKKTASWCAPCGGWGWTTFENLIEDNEDGALLWAMHYSGDLQNATTEGINANLEGSSQPRFYLNMENIVGNGTSIQATIKAGVTENVSMPPVANAIATDFSLIDNTISVTAKSKFFAQADGDYFINVYVVENGVHNQQAGQGADAIHEKVLRGDMAGDAFGVSLVNGAVSAGMEFSTEFSIPVATFWDLANIELHTIIWKKDGNNYSFVNGNEDYPIIIGVQPEPLKGVTFSISPNPVTEETASVFLDIGYGFDGELVLVDGIGQVVLSLAGKNELSSIRGEYTTDMDVSALPNGIYFLRLQSSKGVLTQKIVIER